MPTWGLRKAESGQAGNGAAQKPRNREFLDRRAEQWLPTCRWAYLDCAAHFPRSEWKAGAGGREGGTGEATTHSRPHFHHSGGHPCARGVSTGNDLSGKPWRNCWLKTTQSPAWLRLDEAQAISETTMRWPFWKRRNLSRRESNPGHPRDRRVY